MLVKKKSLQCRCFCSNFAKTIPLKAWEASTMPPTVSSIVILPWQAENISFILKSQVRVNFQAASRWQCRHFWLIFLGWKCNRKKKKERNQNKTIATLKTSYEHTQILFWNVTFRSRSPNGANKMFVFGDPNPTNLVKKTSTR